MANLFPLPPGLPTTLPYQRFIDNEYVPVIKTHMRGIALIEAPFVKLNNRGQFEIGSEIQSGFVVNEGIVTAAHGLCDWDFESVGFNLRPVYIVSIGSLLLAQEVRVLAIDSGTDLALLSMPDLPYGFPLHTFPLTNIGVETGEHLHTVGHPGQLIYSTRDGRVSYPSRSIPSPVPNKTKSPPGFHLIEVGFLTPPGFSGGPLIDTLGAVVSVNHCIELAHYNYISLSVPASYVNELINWHFENPNLVFRRSDGALDYPMGLLSSVVDPTVGFEGEGSGFGGIGAGGEVGEGSGIGGVGAGGVVGEGSGFGGVGAGGVVGEGSGFGGVGAGGVVGEGSGEGWVGAGGEVGDVSSDNFMDVSEFFIDLP